MRVRGILVGYNRRKQLAESLSSKTLKSNIFKEYNTVEISSLYQRYQK